MFSKQKLLGKRFLLDRLGVVFVLCEWQCKSYGFVFVCRYVIKYLKMCRILFWKYWMTECSLITQLYRHAISNINILAMHLVWFFIKITNQWFDYLTPFKMESVSFTNSHRCRMEHMHSIFGILSFVSMQTYVLRVVLFRDRFWFCTFSSSILSCAHHLQFTFESKVSTTSNAVLPNYQWTLNVRATINSTTDNQMSNRIQRNRAMCWWNLPKQ